MLYFKRKAVMLFSIIALIALPLFIGHLLSRPPSEDTVKKNFYAHRVAYEQLRIMLLTDKDLDEVATWGVHATDSPTSKMPPDGGVQANRYQEYLALLKEIGATAVARGKEPLEIRFLVWRSGFAGDSRHVAVSWLEHGPSNTAVSLDEFYRTPKPRSPMYRHIDGNWYIWADW